MSTELRYAGGIFKEIQVIIPGLEEHGLPASDAWQASYKLAT
jgi:hypothetical protein